MEETLIRTFRENDFHHVQQLNELEGWRNLADKQEETRSAWLNSEPALIAVKGNEVIGYLRGLTDGAITLYICELLVKKENRSEGIAEILVRKAHECFPDTRIEMLANKESQGYYEKKVTELFTGSGSPLRR